MNFEQACAVDSDSGRCAGQPSGCRVALLSILGTSLRTPCSCDENSAKDNSRIYECMGWKRLLWVNPCVGEFTSNMIQGRLKNSFFVNLKIFRSLVVLRAWQLGIAYMAHLLS